MSWERKWKEFQTADRLDEAAAQPSSEYANALLNPRVQHGEDEPRGLGSARPLSNERSRVAAQKKAEYDTGMAALQAKATEAEAALGPSPERPEAETEAETEETGSETETTDTKPSYSREQMEAFYNSYVNFLNTPEAASSLGTKGKERIKDMETLFGKPGKEPIWKPGDAAPESWEGVISYDKEEFLSPADAKKARGDERFGSLDDPTAATANKSFRAWLNEPENREQMGAVVKMFGDSDNAKLKSDPTISTDGKADSDHFRAAWKVAGPAFVDAAMSEDGLSDDVAAKLGDFAGTIDTFNQKEVEFEEGEVEKKAQQTADAAQQKAAATMADVERRKAARTKTPEEQLAIRTDVAANRGRFVTKHDPTRKGVPNVSPQRQAAAKEEGNTVYDPIGATTKYLGSKLGIGGGEKKQPTMRGRTGEEIAAALKEKGISPDEVPGLMGKLGWVFTKKGRTWHKEATQEVPVTPASDVLATSLATDAAKKTGTTTTTGTPATGGTDKSDEEESTPSTPTGVALQENISFEKKWKNYQRMVMTEDKKKRKRKRKRTGEGHLAANKFQQKMKKRRRRNDVYTSPAGAKDPSKSKPWSGKVKKFGGSNTYFENLNEADQEVLDSFGLKTELNPAAFEGDVMIPEIRERLMEIAQDFLDGIDFKMDVEDITLTGSLANYNWSKYSDFDLHILVDYEAIDADPDLVKRFFQDIKAIWNIRHNIFLKGYEVEVYVQNTNESHMSSGVYSVQNDEWDIKPEREETARFPIDQPNIEKKADDISFQIDRAEKLFADGKLNDALDAIDRLKQKVRNLRKIGLSKEDGVYSVENLAFKTLRRSMELERLSTLKNKAYDKSMSIAQ